MVRDNVFLLPSQYHKEQRDYKSRISGILHTLDEVAALSVLISAKTALFVAYKIPFLWYL